MCIDASHLASIPWDQIELFLFRLTLLICFVVALVKVIGHELKK